MSDLSAWSFSSFSSFSSRRPKKRESFRLSISRSFKRSGSLLEVADMVGEWFSCKSDDRTEAQFDIEEGLEIDEEISLRTAYALVRV